MESRDCDYLPAVEKYAGIARATDAREMSQPTLTKAIQGVATRAGLFFLVPARRIAPEYEDALKEIHAIRGWELGVLILGYGPSIPTELVLDSCHQLLKERPAARLRRQRGFAHDSLANST